MYYGLCVSIHHGKRTLGLRNFTTRVAGGVSTLRRFHCHIIPYLDICGCLFFSVEKDSHDITQKINDLRGKLQKSREQIEKLPGIDYNKEEQEKQIEVLRQQLASKTELLRRYKNLANFDLTK